MEPEGDVAPQQMPEIIHLLLGQLPSPGDVVPDLDALPAARGGRVLPVVDDVAVKRCLSAVAEGLHGAVVHVILDPLTHEPFFGSHRRCQSSGPGSSSGIEERQRLCRSKELDQQARSCNYGRATAAGRWRVSCGKMAGTPRCAGGESYHRRAAMPARVTTPRHGRKACNRHLSPRGRRLHIALSS